MKAGEKWKLKEEILFNQNEGTLTFRNQRMIVLSAYQLPSIHIEALKIIGPIANTEVYEACSDAIELFFKNQIKILQKLSKEEKFKEFIRQMNEWGIGKIEIAEFSIKKGGIIKVYNGCYPPYYKNAKKPVCYIVAGMLRGMIRALGKRKVEVKENRCIAIGNEYCEFEIG